MTKETTLCKLAYKYGTDKCPRLKHPYTPYYYKLFKSRKKEIKSLFELGIGYYKTMKHVSEHYDPKLGRIYQTGASLKMWRDYFPNAHIYGMDIEPDCMFEDDRITTIVADETKKEDWEKVIKQVGDIDIFIDDGSHKAHLQINTAKMVLPMLKKDVTYIIEDVRDAELVTEGLKDYKCTVPKLKKKWNDDCLILVENK